MTTRGPRIGRADRLAALRDHPVEYRREPGPQFRPSALSLLLAQDNPVVEIPAPPPARAAAVPPAQRAALLTAAATLAEQLMPLPTALGEIATRINRHCAVTRRDAELAHAVELIRARTWDLFCAIDRLAGAAGRKGDLNG